MKLFENTGDGSCAYNAIAVCLYEAIINNTLPLQEKQKEINEFLQIFSAFHLNFNPITFENLKCWLNHYAKTSRDIELLLSPVLRAWFEKEDSNEDLKTVLQNLPKRYGIDAGEDSLMFLSEKFGFNLLLQYDGGIQDFRDLAPQPGPNIWIKHHDNHFNAYVSDEFFKKFHQKGDSILLSRANGSIYNAYTYDMNPLPAVMGSFNQNPRELYRSLKDFQRRLQDQAFEIQRQEFGLSDQKDLDALRKNPIYSFNESDIEDNDIPDQASLILIHQLLQEDEQELLEAQKTLDSINQRSIKP